jgi:SAM-dependent methyltransferase
MTTASIPIDCLQVRCSRDSEQAAEFKVIVETVPKSNANGEILGWALINEIAGPTCHHLRATIVQLPDDDALGPIALDLILSGLITAAVHRNADRVSIAEIESLSEDLRRLVRARALDNGQDEFILADFRRADATYVNVNRLAYDVLADEYSLRADNPGRSQESAERLARLVTDRLDKPVRRILEIGPGSGDVLEALARVAGDVTAVELSPRMAAIASARCPRATVVVGNILDEFFEARAFDGIYAGALIHLFPPHHAKLVLQRISQWTRLGGIVFVNTSIASQDGFAVQTKVDYRHRVSRMRACWTEQSFRSLVQESGLRIIERVTTAEIERGKFWVGLVCTPYENQETEHAYSIRG